MENKPASLLVVPLRKALSGIPPSWCGKQMVTLSRYNTVRESLKVCFCFFVFFLGGGGHLDQVKVCSFLNFVLGFQQQSFPVEETKQETENIRETGTRSSSEPPAPRCSDSPATPEIASLFKDDYKFFSSMSDSDQRRYQELCSRRASSIDSDTQDSYRSTRHNSLLSAHKLRSSSALYASESSFLLFY